VSENHFKDRRIIDKMVDYRRAFRSWDVSAIRVKLSAPDLHKAVGYPPPRPGAEYPNSLTYRGYRIEATFVTR
jgi:hypothetical protein